MVLAYTIAMAVVAAILAVSSFRTTSKPYITTYS